MSTATAGKVLLIPKGEYDATTQYKVLDWVLYQGRPYVAKQTTTGNAPIYAPTPQNPDAYWQLMLDFPTLVDNVPTENSNNLVKSGGVYSALATKQNTLTFDNEPTEGSNNPVKSGGVYSALQKVGHTIKDSTDTYTQRKNLVFDGFYIEDDSTNNATIVYKTKPVPTWANGTVEEIADALQRHYDGEINLHEYWSVGDERTVEIAAMSDDYAQNIPALTLTFVLMNAGGKTLANENSECAFVVGVKESIKYSNTSPCKMNLTNTNVGGWESCGGRTWCNTTFKNALPSDFRALFKQHINPTSAGNRSSSIVNSTDYFAFPSEVEIFGATKARSFDGEGTQFKYYETYSHRFKPNTYNTAQSASKYWCRSPYKQDSEMFVCFDTNWVSRGYGGMSSASTTGMAGEPGFSPFGCI